jgi:hypothetical protein
MLEVFRYQLREPVVLGIRPEMRIKPSELVGSSAAQSQPYERFVRVKNAELRQELFRLTSSILGR